MESNKDPFVVRALYKAYHPTVKSGTRQGVLLVWFVIWMFGDFRHGLAFSLQQDLLIYGTLTVLLLHWAVFKAIALIYKSSTPLLEEEKDVTRITGRQNLISKK